MGHWESGESVIIDTYYGKMSTSFRNTSFQNYLKLSTIDKSENSNDNTIYSSLFESKHT